MKSLNLVAKTKAGSQCQRKLWKEAAGGEERRLSIVREAPVAHCLDQRALLKEKRKGQPSDPDPDFSACSVVVGFIGWSFTQTL